MNPLSNLERTNEDGEAVGGDDHGPDQGVRHGPRQEAELLGCRPHRHQRPTQTTERGGPQLERE